MVTLAWCKKQKNGIELVEPNLLLSNRYILESDDSLMVMLNTPGKWKVITAYYACYNALYAILMKAGIKCEIHDCSLELMRVFDFNSSEIAFMKKLKQDRIDAQYYLKNVSLNDEGRIKSFIIRCKLILKEMNFDKVKKIREIVKND